MCLINRGLFPGYCFKGADGRVYFGFGVEYAEGEAQRADRICADALVGGRCAVQADSGSNSILIVEPERGIRAVCIKSLD